MKLIPRLLQLIPFTRNVGPLRVGPERSQRRLVAKFGGDMPHWAVQQIAFCGEAVISGKSLG